MTDAPERIYLDGDVEAGDGMFPRCFENPKYASEPQVEYIRADLATPEPAVKVKALVWEDHPACDGPVIARAVTLLGTYFIVDDTDDFSGLYLDLISHDDARWWQSVRSTATHIEEHWHGDVQPLKDKAQAHHDATILAALEPATLLDDPRVEALVEAANGVVNEYYNQVHGPVIYNIKHLDAALGAIASPSISALEENK